MAPTDLTIEILKSIRDDLKSIRDEVKQTNGRLDETNRRLDETNRRLDEGLTDLSARIVHSEVRTATAITELAGTVREMTQAFDAAAR